MTLLELADRVEKLSAADRLVDAEIAHECGIKWSSDEDGNFGGYMIMPRRVHFTSSLDAAMTLVPKEMWAEGSLDSPACIEVHCGSVYEEMGKGNGVTPAIALTAACLRARAQEAGR